MTLPSEQFLSFLRERGHPLESYKELHTWSLEHMATFWSQLWDFLEIIGCKTEEHSLDGEMFAGRFFQGATLNVVENFLRGDDAKERLTFQSDKGHKCTLTLNDIRECVASVQDYLRRKGLAPGDCVIGYMPSTPEAVIALLAVVSLGGVWSCAGLELGAEVLIARFSQINPRFFITSFGKHQTEQARPVVQALCKGLTSLESVLILPYAGEIAYTPEPLGDSLLQQRMDASTLVFPQFPFDHPIYIVFSSGTTGKPKCIVHRAGGVLLQHGKEHVLHCELQENDYFFFYSTCSWMMWHWSVSVLLTQARIFLFDGNLLLQGGKALLNLASEEKLTFFGASASYYELVVKHQTFPDLCFVKAVASTGSVLSKDVEEKLGRFVFPSAHIYSISGGTDLLSCFVIGSRFLPSEPGVIQCSGLAMNVEVFDEKGGSETGVKGELVCTKPFPSMPLTFAGDKGESLYYETYFAHYPGVWKQGDFALKNANGSFVLYGRSDSVLKPGGIRVGVAEIYDLLGPIAWIQECLMTTVYGHSQAKEKMILLLVMSDGEQLTEDRIRFVRQHLRSAGSVYFVPAYIYALSALPRTHNGKLSERAAQNILHGHEIDTGALKDNGAVAALQSIYAATINKAKL